MDLILFLATFVIGTILYIGTIFCRQYLQKYRSPTDISKGPSLDKGASDGGEESKSYVYIMSAGGSGARHRDKLSGMGEGFFGFSSRPEHQMLGLRVLKVRRFLFSVGLSGGTGTGITAHLAEGEGALEHSTIVLQHQIARYYLKSKFGDKLSNKDIEDIIFTLVISSGHLYCQDPIFPSFALNVSNKEDPIAHADNAKKPYTIAKMNIKTPILSLITDVKTKDRLIEVGIFSICLAIAFLVLSMAFRIWQSPFP